MLKVSAKQLKMIGPLTKLPGALGGCARQWVGTYIEKLAPDYKPEALVTGIKFHRVCQSLVETHRLPDDIEAEDHLGKMGRAAFSVMPRGPWKAETVEYFPWTTHMGTECLVHLRCDLRKRGAFADWKSCSARKWSLASLEEDIQARLYAAGVMLLDEVDMADATWIYVSKRDYSAWTVPHIFSREDTLSWLHREIDGAIDLIALLRETEPAMAQLPKQLDACEGVGKFCDVVGPCFDKPETPLITIEQLTEYKKAASVPQGD